VTDPAPDLYDISTRLSDLSKRAMHEGFRLANLATAIFRPPHPKRRGAERTYPFRRYVTEGGFFQQEVAAILVELEKELSPKHLRQLRRGAEERRKKRAEYEAMKQARAACEAKEQAEAEHKRFLPGGEGHQSALFFLRTHLPCLQKALGLLAADTATPGLARAVYDAFDAHSKIYAALARVNRGECERASTPAPNVVPLFAGESGHTPGGLAS